MTEDETWDFLQKRQRRELLARSNLDAWKTSGEWVEAQRTELDKLTLRQAFEAGYLAALDRVTKSA
jgi:hypothetical protein